MNILKENINWPAASYERTEIQALINDATSQNLKVLCQEIIKTVPGVVSIYLTGAYAYSKGTVIVKDREVKLLSDYDLVVITNGWASMASLNPSLLQRLKNIYEMNGHPIYEIFIWNIDDLPKLPPTKFLYDFQLAKCIYGEEIRTLVPRISESEIPLTEGLRLIFNRILGAMIPFSPSFFHTVPSIRRRRHLTFESTKLALGSYEALLLLDGAYSLAQKGDIKLFQEKVSSRFPEIMQFDFSVSKLIEQALEYKLRPNAETEKNGIDIWFNSRDLALFTLELFIERLYRIKPSNFEEMLTHFISQDPHPFMFNVTIAFNFWRKYRRMQLKLLYKKPSSALLAARLFLVASIDRAGNFDYALLEKAHDVLVEHVGVELDQKDPQRLWEALKQHLLQNYFDPYSNVHFSLRRQITRFVLKANR